MKKISVKIAAAMTAALMTVSAASLAANCDSEAVSASADTAPKETVSLNKTRDTFEMGSVSKAVCAVCCMKLVDAGKLDLDAPITEYIPEFKMKDERYKEITTRMLLDHTSGIMGNVAGWSLVGDDDGSYHDTFLEKIAEQELKADPGEYGVYCNSGFELAEMVVERVSGMSYSEFIIKEIAEPLGLDSFGTGYVGTDRERFIRSTTYSGRYTDWNNCTDLGSGGLWASSYDLALFSRVLTDGDDFLSKESKAQIMNLISDEDGFGLGLDSTKLFPYDLYGKRAVYKGGTIGNYHTTLEIIPEDDLSIAVCTLGPEDNPPMMICQDIILSVLTEEGLISEEDIAKGNAKLEEMVTEKECDDTPVPESFKKYAGLYGCRGLYNIGFEDNCLTYKDIHSGYNKVYRFRYGGDGKFYSFDGDYISFVGSLGGLGYNTAQKRGTMTVWFEEERGKTFLRYSVAEELKDLGISNTSSMGLEKLAECTASEKAIKAWAEREGNVYKLVGEPYNSDNYLNLPTLMLREDNGYVCGYTPETGFDGMAAVITDEYHTLANTDVPDQGSRDLINYEIAYENGTEYLRGEAYTGNTYRLYESFEGTASLSGQYVLDTPDDAVWFAVSPEDAGAVLRLSPSEKASWFVYDKHGSCIASSLYIDGSDRVILPEDGLLLLAGKSGEYVDIGR